MTPTATIALAIVLPFLGAGLVAVTGRYPNLRETMTLVTAGILSALVASLVPGVANGARLELFVGAMMPGLEIRFTVEPLGMLFAALASFLWFVTSLYSIGYMRGHHEQNQTRFYVYFAVAIGATMGVAFAGNMLTLFAFYELLTLSTFPLVAHHGTEEAKRAGRLYLGLLLGTSIIFQLFAIIWTWTAAGTLDFRAGGILEDKVAGPAVGVLMALYLFGIGKAAVMPFHRWLPAAMVAPTPVSALLHAVAVVKAGVFAVVKVVVYVFGVDFLAKQAHVGWLVYVAGFTVIAASIIALRQDNLKLRLAYSTVSQLSYVVIATVVLAPLSIMGAILHIAAHAFGKITLFFAAGAILVASHKTEVSQLDGIGRRMPWTMAAFAIGALAMIGLPPTVGFTSKWYIVQGIVQDGNWVAAGVIVVSTLLNAAYFVPIVYAAFFRPAVPITNGHAHSHGDDVGHVPLNEHGEAPWTIIAAQSITAAGTVGLFFVPDALLTLARHVVGG
jgi:multicomponent Na+:H+ antiporter subunit D